MTVTIMVMECVVCTRMVTHRWIPRPSPWRGDDWVCAGCGMRRFTPLLSGEICELRDQVVELQERNAKLESNALASAKRESNALASFWSGKPVDGKLEMFFAIGDIRGSAWLDKTKWQSFGDHAGWTIDMSTPEVPASWSLALERPKVEPEAVAPEDGDASEDDPSGERVERPRPEWLGSDLGHKFEYEQRWRMSLTPRDNKNE